MKKNIIAISLMAASLFTFGNVYAADTNCDLKANTLRVDFNDGSHACYAGFGEAIKAVEKDAGQITFLDSRKSGSQTITEDLTIDLGGNALTLEPSAVISIKNANVTIKNGTITTSKSDITNMFNVTSKDNETSLTIADDVKLKFTNTTGGAVVKVLTADAKTTINVNGTWTIPSEIVDCADTDKENLTINLNANVTSDKQLVSMDAGTSIVNVLGGKYTSKDGHAFDVKKGTLNISGGKINAKKGSAIVLRGSNDDSKPLVLNITGGEMVAEGTNNYAINFAIGASNGTYSLAGGTYTSGEDSKGKYLPAILIQDTDFLEEQQGIITGGTYNNGIVGEIKGTNGHFYPAENAIKTLLSLDVTATTDDKGNVVVTTPAPAEQQPTNPEGQGNTPDPTPTPDTTIDDSPQTYDGIMSYVTMALTSVGAVALSLKKVLSR